MNHRHRERKALTHPQWQGQRQAVSNCLQIELRKQFINPLGTLLGGELKQLGVQRQVLAHRQFAVQRK